MSPFTSTIRVKARGGRGPVEPPLPAAATLAPGYTVVSHLSRNRTLDVYDVWSAERECRCIAKTLPPHLRHDRRAARRLLKEGEFLLALAHPHIVRAYETVRRPNPVVVLETLSGETLGRLVERRQRRLSTRELSYLGLHVGSAVQYLHAHNILHLDLKPENVVCTEGKARLIDLSIARRPGWARGAVGTRAFMAPEQFGRGWLTTATDVWGIGVLLYVAAARRLPFVSADPDATERRAPSLANHGRLPADFVALVDACLEPRRSLRPSIGEVLATLRAGACDEKLAAEPDPLTAERP